VDFGFDASFNLGDVAKEIFAYVFPKLLAFVDTVEEKAQEQVNKATEKVEEIFDELMGVINQIEGIANGFGDIMGKSIEFAVDAAEDAVKHTKAVLGGIKDVGGAIADVFGSIGGSWRRRRRRRRTEQALNLRKWEATEIVMSEVALTLQSQIVPDLLAQGMVFEAEICAGVALFCSKDRGQATDDSSALRLSQLARGCEDSEHLAACKASFQYSKEENGCEAFAQGWPKGQYNCHGCGPVSRSYASCNLDECHSLCGDLYAGAGDINRCKQGCDKYNELISGILYTVADTRQICEYSEDVDGRNGCNSDETCLATGRAICDPDPLCFGIAWYQPLLSQGLKVCRSVSMRPKHDGWHTMMKTGIPEGIPEAEFIVWAATSTLVTLKLQMRPSDSFYVWFDDQAKDTVHIQGSNTQWTTDDTRFLLSAGQHILHVGSSTELGAVQIRVTNSCPASWPHLVRYPSGDSHGDVCKQGHGQWSEWDCPSGCTRTGASSPGCLSRFTNGQPCRETHGSDADAKFIESLQVTNQHGTVVDLCRDKECYGANQIVSTDFTLQHVQS